MNHIITHFVLLFFFLDVTLIGFFKYQCVHMLLSLYCASRIVAERMLFDEILLIILFLIEQCLLDDMFGVHLIYVLPLMACINLLQPFFRLDLAILPCASFIFLFCARTLFTHGFTGINTYIFYELCANIGIILLFLKYIVKGRLDNRLCA